MKRLFAIAAVLLLLLTAGCNSPQPQIVNPVENVTGAWDFHTSLGLYLPTPADAENPSYSIISDQIAQIRYTWDGMDFTLRCAETTENISGVYGPFIQYDSIGIIIEHRSGVFTVRTKFPTDGGALGLWQIGDFSYSLYTPDEIEVLTFDDYAAGIALEHLNQAYPSDYSEDYLKITCGGETYYPYLQWVYSGDYDGENFICADGGSNPKGLKQDGKLPVIVYRDNLKIHLNDGIEMSSIILYGEDFKWLDQKWDAESLGELPPGTYYAGIVISQEHEYVPQEDRYTYSGFECLFELIVE